jgi:hypothetical protein|tara:strand:+ start:60 stop:227 length:168 start_codon:yes stop_codon:yes gene_type:complete
MLKIIKSIIMKFKYDRAMAYQDKVYGKFIESLGKPTKKKKKVKEDKEKEEPHLFI